MKPEAMNELKNLDLHLTVDIDILFGLNTIKDFLHDNRLYLRKEKSFNQFKKNFFIHNSKQTFWNIKGIKINSLA